MLSFAISWKKVNALITLFLLVMLLNLNAHASEVDVNIEKINQAIQQKLDYYNQTFPDIQFVHLRNGEWQKSLEALELLIGYQATNLDYEHPADLREDLLFVTVYKIRMMLINGIASSYLFEVGEMAAARRKYACVITVDPAKNVLTNEIATQYFIDLSPQTLSSLPPSRLLDKQQQIDFIIDHEVFHCLDTLNYGGIPMSDKGYSTHYDCYMRESQADMFAIAMNIKRNKHISTFVDNMLLMRGMTLLNGELQHDSVDAIKLITNSDIKEIISSTTSTLFRNVKKLYKAISPNYDEYMRFRVAAVHAINQLGRTINEREEPFYPPGSIPDMSLVNQLVNNTKFNYREYTGKTYTQ